MERMTYTTAAIQEGLGDLEAAYGMTSAEFIEAYKSESESIAHVPGFQRHLWASFYTELLDSNDAAFRTTLKDELLPA